MSDPGRCPTPGSAPRAAADLGLPVPADGWPEWVETAPYVAGAHPLAERLPPLDEGANCQRYAYSVLQLLGRRVPHVRSSELWSAPLLHPDRADAEPLDLALFNGSPSAWGAHVAVVTPAGLLHLCAEVGRPAIWSWDDFAARPRYARLVGLVRPSEREPTGA